MALRAGRLRPPSQLSPTQLLRWSSGGGNGCTNTNLSDFTSTASPSHQHTDHVVPEFGDPREAYRSKSFSELLRHYVVFKAFTFKYLVDHNKSLMELCQRLFGESLFAWMMKKTIYGQFVAGEDLATIRPKIEHLRVSGVRSILDYAVEEDLGKGQEVVMEVRQTAADSVQLDSKHYTNPQFKPSKVKGDLPTTRSSALTHFYAGEQRCEDNVAHFKSCIETASQANAGSDLKDAFAAIKLTGLGRVEFLLRFSEVVTNNQAIFMNLAGRVSASEGEPSDIVTAAITAESFQGGLRRMEISLKESVSERLFKQLDEDEAGKVNVYEFCNRFQPGTELHRLFQTSASSAVSAVLSHDERDQMNTVVKRAEILADFAQERGVRLLVDAEQTYFQPAIRHIAVNVLMPKYNMDTPTIYNTIQCYLKEAEKWLRMELALADMTGCLYCVKLVRGAYMEQERERAAQNGYPDPIWPDKPSTDRCYHRLMELLMQEKTGSPPSPVHFMVASHNEGTIRTAIEKMEEYGISKSDGTVVFGQLLGMCDNITFPLGQAGYGAYKYMPYGPVKEVLPYLSRRANENRGVLEGAQRERALVRRELLRRLGLV